MALGNAERNEKIVRRFAELVGVEDKTHNKSIDILMEESSGFITRTVFLTVTKEWRENHPEVNSSIRGGGFKHSVDIEAREMIATLHGYISWEDMVETLNR